MEGLLHALRASRDFDPRRYCRLVLGVHEIGWVRRAEAERLRAWPEVFGVSTDRISVQEAPEEKLTAILAEVAAALARDGAVRGWRGETYAVRACEGVSAGENAAGGTTLFHIERAAMRFFGLRFAAAHLNGFVFQDENTAIWVARRAATKSIDPGMLDNLVAGGVLSSEQAWQALLRECGEEAGIPPALAGKAHLAGALRVCHDVPEGLNNEVLHIHDLALPPDFMPRNSDGEVSEFLSLAAPALLERISGGEMTVEAGLVAADFVLRRRLVREDGGRIAALIEACREPTPP